MRAFPRLTVLAALALSCASSGKPMRDYVPAARIDVEPFSDLPRDAELDALFAKLTWRDVAEKEESAERPRWVGVSSERMVELGFSLTRLRKARNPDAHWILQWEDEAKPETVLQAVINRSWGDDCRADYKDYKAKWRELEPRFRPRIEALSKLDYYAATQGLVALHNELLEQARDFYLSRRRWSPQGNITVHPMAFAGLAFEIAEALVEIQKKNGHLAYAYDVLELLRDPDGIPLGADYVRYGGVVPDGVARNRFCWGAMRVGTHRTPPLPLVPGIVFEEGRYPPIVSWDNWASSGPGPSGPLAPLERSREQGPPRTLTFDQLSRTGSEFFALRPYSVASVVRKENRVELTLVSRNDDSFLVRCSGATAFEHGIMRDACTHGTATVDTTARVQFTDLPSSLDVRRGDLVGVDGVLEWSKTRLVLDQKLRKLTKRSMLIQGKRVRTIVRGDDVVLSLGPT